MAQLARRLAGKTALNGSFLPTNKLTLHPNVVYNVPQTSLHAVMVLSGVPRRLKRHKHGLTHDGDASFAQVAVLLLQRFALQLERLELDLQHFVLLLQRRESVCELLQSGLRDHDALCFGGGVRCGRSGVGGGRRGAGGLRGGRATAAARTVRVALARAVRHGVASSLPSVRDGFQIERKSISGARRKRDGASVARLKRERSKK